MTAERPVRLSVSMIVRNEERFLAGCLESVKGIADEVVLVDTGSADRTLEIAREAGARVVNMQWPDDFSAARNESLRHCSGEWILYLDADERLGAGQEELLRSLMDRRDVTACSCIVRSVVGTPTGKSTQVLVYPRLFRRDGRLAFEGRVHEQIIPSIRRMGGKIERTGLVIDHLGYDRDAVVMEEKQRRNLALLLAHLVTHPRDPYAHYQAGVIYLLQQEYPAARSHLDLASGSAGLDPGLRAAILNQRADLEIRCGRHAEAAAHCVESLRLAPRQSTAGWYLAGAWIHLGRYQEAVSAIDGVLDHMHAASSAGEPMVVVDQELDEAVVLHVKGQCQAALGDLDTAVETVCRALQHKPGARDVFSTLMDLHGRLGRVDLALEHLTRLCTLMPGDPVVLLALADWSRKAGRREEARCVVADLVKEHPRLIEAHVRKVRWYLDDGKTAEAESAFAAAESLGEPSFELARCGLDLALSRGDLRAAVSHIHHMLCCVPPGNGVLVDRLRELAARYGGQLQRTTGARA